MRIAHVQAASRVVQRHYPQQLAQFGVVIGQGWAVHHEEAIPQKYKIPLSLGRSNKKHSPMASSRASKRTSPAIARLAARPGCAAQQLQALHRRGQPRTVAGRGQGQADRQGHGSTPPASRTPTVPRPAADRRQGGRRQGGASWQDDRQRGPPRSATPRPRPGEVKVTLKVDPLPGEVSQVNNEISTYVTVTKEGVSVLYVEGKYRAWEPKFIRYALSQDPRIRLVRGRAADRRAAAGRRGRPVPVRQAALRRHHPRRRHGPAAVGRQPAGRWTRSTSWSATRASAC